MKINLTVVGLDRIGLSIGMVFAKKGKENSILGWDADLKKIEAARGLHVFNQLTSKMEEGVKFADLILIDLPLDEVEDSFIQFAKWVKKDAVILYFSASPEKVASWANQILPEFVHFVALTPGLNPRYLDDWQDNTPHDDLFENSRIFISHVADLPPRVIQIAAEVTSLLGAEPCFADLAEVNGLQAITHILPFISAATVMDEVIHEPGWKDASQLAGAELVGTTRLLDAIMDENQGEVLVSNQENSLRVIANLQDSLAELAVLIKKGDSQELQDKLAQLRIERESWLRQRRNVQEKKTSSRLGRK
jgi:prephenate dehydrogenase